MGLGIRAVLQGKPSSNLGGCSEHAAVVRGWFWSLSLFIVHDSPYLRLGLTTLLLSPTAAAVVLVVVVVVLT